MNQAIVTKALQEEYAIRSMYGTAANRQAARLAIIYTAQRIADAVQASDPTFNRAKFLSDCFVSA